MSSTLRKFASWIKPPYPPQLWARAIELINAADSFEGAAGDYKRHKVYAQLIKENPHTRKRDLALLIEVVMQERN